MYEKIVNRLFRIEISLFDLFRLTEFLYTYANTDSAKGESVKDEDNSSSSVQRAFSIIRALAATVVGRRHNPTSTLAAASR